MARRKYNTSNENDSEKSRRERIRTRPAIGPSNVANQGVSMADGSPLPEKMSQEMSQAALVGGGRSSRPPATADSRRQAIIQRRSVTDPATGEVTPGQTMQRGQNTGETTEQFESRRQQLTQARMRGAGSIGTAVAQEQRRAEKAAGFAGTGLSRRELGILAKQRPELAATLIEEAQGTRRTEISEGSETERTGLETEAERGIAELQAETDTAISGNEIQAEMDRLDKVIQSDAATAEQKNAAEVIKANIEAKSRVEAAVARAGGDADVARIGAEVQRDMAREKRVTEQLKASGEAENITNSLQIKGGVLYTKSGNSEYPLTYPNPDNPSQDIPAIYTDRNGVRVDARNIVSAAREFGLSPAEYIEQAGLSYEMRTQDGGDGQGSQGGIARAGAGRSGQ